MKRLLIMAGIVLFLAGNVMAQQIDVKIKGMVCSFCAQGLEKKFGALPEVEKVGVSLKEKNVSLTLKEGKNLSDADIKKIVLDAGYNVQEIKRAK